MNETRKGGGKHALYENVLYIMPPLESHQMLINVDDSTEKRHTHADFSLIRSLSDTVVLYDSSSHLVSGKI